MERKNFLIKTLELQPHPEGGYFKEIYRCDESLSGIATRFNGKQRNTSTAIYYMLCRGDISHFHRIKSDEIWHHYEGDKIVLYIIENGILKTEVLGSADLAQKPIVVVKHGAWFAAESSGLSGYTLAGCTVAPGFDFEDFEMANGPSLMADYPEFAETIKRFT